MSILFVPDIRRAATEWFLSKRDAKRAHASRHCTKRPMTIVAPDPLPPGFERCSKCVGGSIKVDTKVETQTIHTFRCVTPTSPATHTVTVERSAGQPTCDCDVFRDRGGCRHVDFVLARVVCAPADLVDTLKEYGDLDDDERHRFWDCVKTGATHTTRDGKRACAACRGGMAGIDVDATRRGGHWFHTACAERLGLLGLGSGD